jgi:hypothetical protein
MVEIHVTGERTIEVYTDQYMKCIEDDPSSEFSLAIALGIAAFLC